jgi:hypothetical protein
MMENYVDAEYASQGAAVRVAMNLPAALIFLLFGRRFALDGESYKVWRNMSIAAFAALGLLILTSSSTAVDRSALYIIPLQLYVLSRMPRAFGRKGNADVSLIVLVIAYSAAIQFVWLNYAVHAEYWIPYKTYPLLGSEF